MQKKWESIWSENVRIGNCLNRKLYESENVESENSAQKIALGNCRIGKRTRAGVDQVCSHVKRILLLGVLRVH